MSQLYGEYLHYQQDNNDDDICDIEISSCIKLNDSKNSMQNLAIPRFVKIIVYLLVLFQNLRCLGKDNAWRANERGESGRCFSNSKRETKAQPLLR